MTISRSPFVLISGVPRARDDEGDRDLLRQLAAGRPEALAQLYDRHAASLFRHALALTRDRSDAEDLVQAVFVKLAARGAPLLGVRQPESYLHRVLHTTWLDTRRRVVTGERVVERMHPQSSAAPNNPAAIDLSRAIDALPAAQREVIVLHLVEGFSFREMGRLIGVSMFTAAARYRLAIRRLQKHLSSWSGDKR